MATTIELSNDTDQRLDSLVSQTGRSKAYYLKEIVKRGLEDLEDYYLAAQVAERVRRGEVKTHSSGKVSERGSELYRAWRDRIDKYFDQAFEAMSREDRVATLSAPDDFSTAFQTLALSPAQVSDPKQRTLADCHPQQQHNKDRMRRAESWLKRSRQSEKGSVERFVFLWISFNSAYGVERSKKKNEIDSVRSFLTIALEKDKEAASKDKARLEEIFSFKKELIAVILENPCISEQFWDYVHKRNSIGEEWREKFTLENDNVLTAWENRDLENFLPPIFSRLYILRNQVIHGGATHPHKAGERQIKHGTALMDFLIPGLIKIVRKDIEKNPNSKSWGKVEYPSFSPDLLYARGIKDHEIMT